MRSNHISILKLQRGWICHFTPQSFGHIITYPCRELNHLSKKGPRSIITGCHITMAIAEFRLDFIKKPALKIPCRQAMWYILWVFRGEIYRVKESSTEYICGILSVCIHWYVMIYKLLHPFMMDACVTYCNICKTHKGICWKVWNPPIPKKHSKVFLIRKYWPSTFQHCLRKTTILIHLHYWRI